MAVPPSTTAIVPHPPHTSQYLACKRSFRIWHVCLSYKFGTNCTIGPPTVHCVAARLHIYNINAVASCVRCRSCETGGLGGEVTSVVQAQGSVASWTCWGQWQMLGSVFPMLYMSGPMGQHPPSCSLQSQDAASRQEPVHTCLPGGCRI